MNTRQIAVGGYDHYCCGRTSTLGAKAVAFPAGTDGLLALVATRAMLHRPPFGEECYFLYFLSLLYPVLDDLSLSLFLISLIFIVMVLRNINMNTKDAAHETSWTFPASSCFKDTKC